MRPKLDHEYNINDNWLFGVDGSNYSRWVVIDIDEDEQNRAVALDDLLISEEDKKLLKFYFFHESALNTFSLKKKNFLKKRDQLM